MDRGAAPALEQGWVPGARQCRSPNWDQRPEGCDPELIVVHGISLPPGEFGGPWVDRLFLNRIDPEAHPFFSQLQGLAVSSHFLIRRDGELVQYVPCHGRAWHAGLSTWRGRSRCNDFSLGIELEGTDDIPYTAAQYRRLAGLIGLLRRAYPTIAADALAGHSDIAPGRKTDPGPVFDWAHLRSLLRGEC